MRLTFFGLTPYKIEHSNNLIPLIEKSIPGSGTILFDDITDVISNSEENDIGSYIRFSVFLFEEGKPKTSSSGRRGMLIGHLKDEGSMLLGIWPYTWFQELNKKLPDGLNEIIQILSDSKNITNSLYIKEK